MSQDQKLQTISPRKTKQNFSGLEKKKGVENILEKAAEGGNGEKSELGGVRAMRLQDWSPHLHNGHLGPLGSELLQAPT